MPQPTPGDVHVNRPLTNISIAYLQSQEDFVASKVFPNIPVMKQSDSYFTYPKGQWFRSDSQKRGLSQESAGTGYTVSTDTYRCAVDALHKDIDDQLRANADQPISLDKEAALIVAQQMLLRKELDWAAAYFTTGLWTGSTTGTDIVPGTKWDASGSTPIAELRAQISSVKKNTGFRPNKLVLAEDVWTALQDNADFLDRISVDQRKIVTKDLLAAVLEISDVVVAGAVQNTALEGATASMDWVMTDDALLLYANPNPSIMQPSAGYTFSWKGYLGAGVDGMRTKRFRMEQINSDRVETEMAYNMKLVAADLGAFFNGCLT